jgi:hypothetical protein
MLFAESLHAGNICWICPPQIGEFFAAQVFPFANRLCRNLVHYLLELGFLGPAPQLHGYLRFLVGVDGTAIFDLLYRLSLASAKSHPVRQCGYCLHHMPPFRLFPELDVSRLGTAKYARRKAVR